VVGTADVLPFGQCPAQGRAGNAERLLEATREVDGCRSTQIAATSRTD
jgi:hypothetical protein